MFNKKQPKEKYMGAVKVGPKGQIVIPKDVRDMFDINPGDTLLLLADEKKGIAIERISVFEKIADMILDVKASEMYPEYSEEDSIMFAEDIKKIKNGDENDGD